MRTRLRRILFGGLAAAILLAAPGPVATAAQGVNQRPISDFLEVQTLADIVDWMSGEEGNVEYRARVDYLGVIDRFFATPNGVPLGTTFDGHVTERVREDGKTEVHVVLFTQHALGAVGQGATLTPATTVWGRLAGFAIPRRLGMSFCDVRLDLRYATSDPPGATLPRLVPLLFTPRKDQELIQVHVSASGDGELRALFGVEDGTPGRMTVNQKGIFNAAFEGGVADWEPFPGSLIELRPVGN
jgi:hypothetical protein